MNKQTMRKMQMIKNSTNLKIRISVMLLSGVSDVCGDFVYGDRDNLFNNNYLLEKNVWPSLFCQ